MPKISVRPAQDADFPTVAELFHQYRAFYGFEHTDTERLKAEEFLRRRFHLHESTVLVVEFKDHIAGFCHYYPTFDSLTLTSSLALHDLFVEPKFRNQDCGIRMMEKVIATAKAQQCDQISVQAQPTNVIALALYSSFGFTQKTRTDELITLTLDLHS
ncbi:MAG: GNAT family N-acetyltransferase [Corynebacterium sp.]|uniref:GNAT family N-acetyltransferase n=1 Tax=Corynebacterium sp. TaxID=1720 RepID=UPI0026DAF5EA|nr:GNAT family N-acetyltransferase [Corynebacterium sp.]MDO4762204.1 GNAT family N-acetyltransferase [Corynebacterium sp.]